MSNYFLDPRQLWAQVADVENGANINDMFAVPLDQIASFSLYMGAPVDDFTVNCRLSFEIYDLDRKRYGFKVLRQPDEKRRFKISFPEEGEIVWNEYGLEVLLPDQIFRVGGDTGTMSFLRKLQ